MLLVWINGWIMEYSLCFIYKDLIDKRIWEKFLCVLVVIGKMIKVIGFVWRLNFLFKIMLLREYIRGKEILGFRYDENLCA